MAVYRRSARLRFKCIPFRSPITGTSSTRKTRVPGKSVALTEITEAARCFLRESARLGTIRGVKAEVYRALGCAAVFLE